MIKFNILHAQLDEIRDKIEKIKVWGSIKGQNEEIQNQ
jgi:hypothetical protein